jgi:hypothetical protein
MADPIFFAPIRVPVSDPRTGLMSREWYLFFHQLFQRVGGPTDPSADDAFVNPPSLDASAQAVLFSMADALALTPATYPQGDTSTVPSALPDAVLGELHSLRDQVAELTKQLQDIRQGTLI